MGQFKPMVKMMTDEPKVELKLKKGGVVKKAVGGGMSGRMRDAMPRRRGMPIRDSAPPTVSPDIGTTTNPPAAMGGLGTGLTFNMKKGGKATMSAATMKEGGKADMEQDKRMIKKAFKQHDQQEHKGSKGTTLKLKGGGMSGCGYKTGGVPKGQGGYKTGGVVKGQGGYKTGGVVKGQGGYKKGGMVDTGRPEPMPQGKKKPSPPVAISRLTGTFKKGGAIKC